MFTVLSKRRLSVVTSGSVCVQRVREREEGDESLGNLHKRLEAATWKAEFYSINGIHLIPGRFREFPAPREPPTFGRPYHLFRLSLALDPGVLALAPRSRTPYSAIGRFDGRVYYA